KAEQREWVRTRDLCPDFECMKKAYQERMTDLEKLAASHPNPQTLKIQNASRRYDLTITIGTCEGEKQNNCWGEAHIRLYKKGEKTSFQTIDMPNAEISKDTIPYNPAINKKAREFSYDETYDIVFEDFNFDGEEDLAIHNGNEGGYGSPSYN